MVTITSAWIVRLTFIAASVFLFVSASWWDLHPPKSVYGMVTNALVPYFLFLNGFVLAGLFSPMHATSQRRHRV